MMLKKFLALALAANFLAFTPVPAFAETTPAFAEIGEDKIAAAFAVDTEKFIDSLPVAKGKYKSRQRPILIGGAMNSEINLLVRALKNPVVYRHLNYVYVAGTYRDYPVVISRTEEVIPNAAASTALALTNFNPIAVINQGTAGGYLDTLKIGDIVICSSTVNTSAIKLVYQPAGAGIDITQQEMLSAYAYDKNAGRFRKYDEFAADPTLLNLAESIYGFDSVTGVIATSSSWVSNIDYINFLHEKYGAVCEEMETFAVAQICHGSGVPFIGIRTISNNITNGSTYTPEAAESAQRFVLILTERYIRDVLKK